LAENRKLEILALRNSRYFRNSKRCTRIHKREEKSRNFELLNFLYTLAHASLCAYSVHRI
jgi:hypothetical protein